MHNMIGPDQEVERSQAELARRQRMILPQAYMGPRCQEQMPRASLFLFSFAVRVISEKFRFTAVHPGSLTSGMLSLLVPPVADGPVYLAGLRPCGDGERKPFASYPPGGPTHDTRPSSGSVFVTTS